MYAPIFTAVKVTWFSVGKEVASPVVTSTHQQALKYPFQHCLSSYFSGNSSCNRQVSVIVLLPNSWEYHVSNYITARYNGLLENCRISQRSDLPGILVRRRCWPGPWRCPPVQYSSRLWAWRPGSLCSWSAGLSSWRWHHLWYHDMLTRETGWDFSELDNGNNVQLNNHAWSLALL